MARRSRTTRTDRTKKPSRQDHRDKRTDNRQVHATHIDAREFSVIEMTELLEALFRTGKRGTLARLINAVKYATYRAAARQGLTEGAYLKSFRTSRSPTWDIEEALRDLNNPENLDWPVFASRLANVILKRQLTLDDIFPMVPMPYRRWRGQTAVVVVPVRCWQIPTDRQAVQPANRFAVDESDMMAAQVAQSELTELDCRIEYRWLRTENTRYADALRLFNELRSRTDVGAIISIGSRVANALSVVISEQVLEPVGLGYNQLPAYFRWSIDWDDDLTDRDSLSDPTRHDINDIGVCYRSTDAYDVIRRNNSSDAGILLVADRPRCSRDQTLVVAAGHGGRATQATVEAAFDIHKISQMLRQSRDTDVTERPIPRDTAKNIVITTIAVHRRGDRGDVEWRWKFKPDLEGDESGYNLALPHVWPRA